MPISNGDVPEPLALRIGELRRSDLLATLDSLGVRRNNSANILLEHPLFESPNPALIHVVVHTVEALGFSDGTNYSSLLNRAREIGLRPCPPITGPYLRIATSHQKQSSNSVLSNGTAPQGSLTVALEPLNSDDEYPKGFYLRVIDGVLWLRGYRATDKHMWSPDDHLNFRAE